MFETFLSLSLVWVMLLVGVVVVMAVRSPDLTRRIVLSDTVVQLVLVGLVLIALLRDEPYFLDAALVLALLSFVSSVAIAAHAARHREEG